MAVVMVVQRCGGRAWRRTSSASRKASCSGVPSPTTSSSLPDSDARVLARTLGSFGWNQAWGAPRLSLGMTISVSTLLRSVSIPSEACMCRSFSGSCHFASRCNSI